MPAATAVATMLVALQGGEGDGCDGGDAVGAPAVAIEDRQV